MKNATLLTLLLPVLCAGCLTPPAGYDPNYDPYYGPYYKQPKTNVQVQQSRVKMKQKQKVIHHTNTQNVEVYQNSRHYPGNAPGYAPAYGQRYYNRDAHAYNQQVYQQIQNQQQARNQQQAQSRQQPNVSNHFYQQRGQNQALEAQQVEQARQNSIATASEAAQRRQSLEAEEARQIEQAKQESLRTYAEENARRRQQDLAAEEARQIEQATQASLQTHAEEEAKRQQNAIPAYNPPPPLPEPVQPIVVEVPKQKGGNNWKPSEGQLVQAGQLIMDLRNNKGGINPTHGEMSDNIQSNMGLSEQQAQKVIRKLGV